MAKKKTTKKAVAAAAVDAVAAAVDADAPPKVTTVEWTLDTGEPSKLRKPTFAELLNIPVVERKFLMRPWLREEQNCMVYAAAGVGKSLFALSLAIAVAGGGKFLNWEVQPKEGGWKVLYLDGEMHLGDIQDRARDLLDAVDDVDREQVNANLSFIVRQDQEPGAEFPSITKKSGWDFIIELVREEGVNLIILDNFSTLGEVEDENSASSFNKLTEFLLLLKTAGCATILVHHAGKAKGKGSFFEAGDFRGSSKLAATFEHIIRLEHPRDDVEQGQAEFNVIWQKHRGGGHRQPKVNDVLARLTTLEGSDGAPRSHWVAIERGADSRDGRIFDMWDRMQAGAFATQEEMATHYAVSPTQIGKDVKAGATMGIWPAGAAKAALTKVRRKRSREGLK
jgi:KaiC/GvpD/RAD55 family RecA-like ATPase